MTVRQALIAAAAIITLAAPATAQEMRTFDAWGHTFSTMDGSAVAGATRVPAPLATGTVAPRRAYASGRAGDTLGEASAAPTKASGILNVWGARFEARTH